MDPLIFGTLFERGMDPAKRSQLGAHYLSREDIETLVEPVVMALLRGEWQETVEVVENVLTTGKKKPAAKERERAAAKPLTGGRLKKARTETQILLQRVHQRLTQVKVLDPACGSGNWLAMTSLGSVVEAGGMADSAPREGGTS